MPLQKVILLVVCRVYLSILSPPPGGPFSTPKRRVRSVLSRKRAPTHRPVPAVSCWFRPPSTFVRSILSVFCLRSQLRRITIKGGVEASPYLFCVFFSLKVVFVLLFPPFSVIVLFCFPLTESLRDSPQSRCLYLPFSLLFISLFAPAYLPSIQVHPGRSGNRSFPVYRLPAWPLLPNKRLFRHRLPLLNIPLVSSIHPFLIWQLQHKIRTAGIKRKLTRLSHLLRPSHRAKSFARANLFKRMGFAKTRLP